MIFFIILLMCTQKIYIKLIIHLEKFPDDDFSSSDATYFREEDNNTKPNGSSTASSSHSKSEREEGIISLYNIK